MLMDSESRPDLREKKGGIVLYMLKKYLTFICLHIGETYSTYRMDTKKFVFASILGKVSISPPKKGMLHCRRLKSCVAF